MRDLLYLGVCITYDKIYANFFVVTDLTKLCSIAAFGSCGAFDYEDY